MHPAGHAAPADSRTTFSKPHRPWSRKRKWIVGIVAVLLVLVVALRIYLASIALYSVNRVLGDMPDYYGHAEAVSIHLWRGAYQIEKLTLQKKTKGKPPEPFIDLPVTDFSLEWGPLLHGRVVGKVRIEHPKLNLIDSPDASEKQLTISETWGQKFQKLFPLQINRLVIHDGELSFKNRHSSPPVDLKMTGLEVVGTNLNNGVNSKDELSASIDLHSKILKTASLKSAIKLNPVARLPDFNLTMELTHVSFPELNDFLRAYAGVDAESGTLEAYSELRVKGGKMDGYLKPLIKDIHLVKLDDITDDPLRFIKESLATLILFFFTNHGNDTVATRVPLTGSVDQPAADWLSVVGTLLYNAWIQHLPPGLEQLHKDGEKKKD
ncbi:MAG TPA: DUF748 domain-containing protein [Candidatus Methylacidiphilales bacterium]